MGDRSRVELEAMLWQAMERGDIIEADALRDELAARTWQGVNPYADQADQADPWRDVPPPERPWEPDNE